MPRKLRYAKPRLDEGALKPSVLDFLESGSTAMAERDISLWAVMTLTGPPAHEARTLWAAGDPDGAVAALRRCAASHNLFVHGAPA